MVMETDLFGTFVTIYPTHRVNPEELYSIMGVIVNSTLKTEAASFFKTLMKIYLCQPRIT